MNKQYTVINRGTICALSGNMMNRYFITIETINEPRPHTYDILSRNMPTVLVGEVVTVDLDNIDPFDKSQLT